MEFREATLYSQHPCWRRVPQDDVWSRPENWAYMWTHDVPVEVDWLVRKDNLAVGAPRLASPPLACGCQPVKVYVNVQPSMEDATTWTLPPALIRAAADALRPADVDAYLAAPWTFPDFDAPALAITVIIVAGTCRTDAAGISLPPLSHEDILRAAVVYVSRLLFTLYPLRETNE
jgi:hypothetical protein